MSGWHAVCFKAKVASVRIETEEFKSLKNQGPFDSLRLCLVREGSNLGTKPFTYCEEIKLILNETVFS